MVQDGTWDRLRELFDLAVDLAADARRELLDREVPDGILRGRVEALLAAHDAGGATLDTGPVGSGVTHAATLAGDAIGPYKLLEQIGEGGFGVVFLAEQRQPFQRRVALKLLRADASSSQILARFEAERQALALMDHPNIASVFDAGATASGQPYFVMEYVAGLPITEYADTHLRFPVSDGELAQLVCALRILLPDAGLVLSTREGAAFRDGMLRLGITHVSAGSATEPGGYAQPSGSGRQFEIEDRRTPEQVAGAIRGVGRDPVWKDWEAALHG